ncbi:zinc finger domain-containing protein [Streptomyces celluloflavus]|uniref:zinc finger domain-containing protein n=1 Tax=Streptomyces celluloflavus TaxID=58344 RepID=UPI003675D484
MTPAELAEVLGFAAFYDNRTLGEGDVRAWHLIVGRLDAADARQAVIDHYGTTRDRMMPADMLRLATRSREDHAADIQGPGLPPEIPDADPDDVPAYLAAVREQRHHAAAPGPRRPVRELLAGVGRAIPRPTRGTGPRSVPCATCGAEIGRPCTRPSGARRATYHSVRIDAAPPRAHLQEAP